MYLNAGCLTLLLLFKRRLGQRKAAIPQHDKSFVFRGLYRFVWGHPSIAFDCENVTEAIELGREFCIPIRSCCVVVFRADEACCRPHAAYGVEDDVLLGIVASCDRITADGALP